MKCILKMIMMASLAYFLLNATTYASCVAYIFNNGVFPYTMSAQTRHGDIQFISPGCPTDGPCIIKGKTYATIRYTTSAVWYWGFMHIMRGTITFKDAH